MMKRYDPGLLDSYGGGTTSWWFSYIEKLLDDAHDFYREQVDEEKQELADILNKIHKEQVDDLMNQIEQYLMERAGEDW